MSVSDYHSLTEVEKSFIRKQYERKTISFFTHLRNAVFNAVSNAMRKKGSRFIDLFKKKQAKADKEFNENAKEIVLEMEESQGKSWVDLIYQRNGLKKPLSKQERGNR